MRFFISQLRPAFKTELLVSLNFPAAFRTLPRAGTKGGALDYGIFDPFLYFIKHSMIKTYEGIFFLSPRLQN
jgi:hypothetical protein